MQHIRIFNCILQANDMTVERLERDVDALTHEQQLSAVMADAPELAALLGELQGSLAEVRSHVGPVLREVMLQRTRIHTHTYTSLSDFDSCPLPTLCFYRLGVILCMGERQSQMRKATEVTVAGLQTFSQPTLLHQPVLSLNWWHDHIEDCQLLCCCCFVADALCFRFVLCCMLPINFGQSMIASDTVIDASCSKAAFEIV